MASGCCGRAFIENSTIWQGKFNRRSGNAERIFGGNSTVYRNARSVLLNDLGESSCRSCAAMVSQGDGLSSAAAGRGDKTGIEAGPGKSETAQFRYLYECQPRARICDLFAATPMGWQGDSVTDKRAKCESNHWAIIWS